MHPPPPFFLLAVARRQARRRAEAVQQPLDDDDRREPGRAAAPVPDVVEALLLRRAPRRQGLRRAEGARPVRLREADEPPAQEDGAQDGGEARDGELVGPRRAAPGPEDEGERHQPCGGPDRERPFPGVDEPHALAPAEARREPRLVEVGERARLHVDDARADDGLLLEREPAPEVAVREDDRATEEAVALDERPRADDHVARERHAVLDAHVVAERDRAAHVRARLDHHVLADRDARLRRVAGERAVGGVGEDAEVEVEPRPERIDARPFAAMGEDGTPDDAHVAVAGGERPVPAHGVLPRGEAPRALVGEAEAPARAVPEMPAHKRLVVEVVEDLDGRRPLRLAPVQQMLGPALGDDAEVQRAHAGEVRLGPGRSVRRGHDQEGHVSTPPFPTGSRGSSSGGSSRRSRASGCGCSPCRAAPGGGTGCRCGPRPARAR